MSGDVRSSVQGREECRIRLRVLQLKVTRTVSLLYV